MTVDLDALRFAIPGMVEERGLRLIAGAAIKEPVVFFHGEEVPIDVALDIAAEVRAPFVVVRVDDFDIDEAIEEIDGAESREAQRGIRELRRDYEPHDGEPALIWVSWVAQGTVYAWSATADWMEQFDTRGAELVADDLTERQAAAMLSVERADALACQLEAEPTFRRAPTPTKRVVIGERLLDQLREPADADGTIAQALEWAKRLCARNAEATYIEVEPNLTTLAKELIETDGWRNAERVPEKDGGAEAFLIDRADGYAPRKPMVTQFRRLAIAAERGPVTFLR